MGVAHRELSAFPAGLLEVSAELEPQGGQDGGLEKSASPRELNR